MSKSACDTKYPFTINRYLTFFSLTWSLPANNCYPIVDHLMCCSVYSPQTGHLTTAAAGIHLVSLVLFSSLPTGSGQKLEQKVCDRRRWSDWCWSKWKTFRRKDTQQHMRFARTSIRPSLTFLLLLLTCLHTFGLYLFLNGFLLTRQTLDIVGVDRPVWDQFPLAEQTHQQTTDFFNRNLLPPKMPSQKPFRRAMVIVIDALRFDFMLQMPNASNSSQDRCYYRNRLPIIQHLHKTRPASSLLFQFRADPPTTTMQRVKGLMTGSLPTFIDAGSNFASSAVGEDHLLHHLRQRYDNIYFMGDDTWVNLFPKVFSNTSKTFESDSFKMFDLDTVDNRILSRLWPILEQDQEWQLVIAHFLGVDHCGHTFGPSHPKMASKLSQMNSVLERLVQYVDNDTLLIVMGDHGMSVEGDHGGESVEELMSGLFMYSTRDLTLLPPLENGRYYRGLYQRLHQKRVELLGYQQLLHDIRERLEYDPTEYPIVSQIHLVPTLAYLLNVSIPFGNLGAVIPDVLIPEDGTVVPSSKHSVLLHMAQQFRVNALQVYTYLTQYWNQTNHPGFAPESLRDIYTHLWHADRLLKDLFATRSLMDNDDSDEETFSVLEEAILSYDAFLMRTIRYCQSIWAQFDVGCMAAGILVLSLTVCVTVYIARIWRPCINSRRMVLIWFSTLVAGFLAVGVAFAILRALAVPHAEWFEKMSHTDWAASSAALCLLVTTLFSIEEMAKPAKPMETKTWWMLVIGTVAQSFTLASNSFVVWEDRGVRFVAATLCVWWLFLEVASTRTLKAGCMSMAAPLIVLSWVRLTGLTGQCREEQFPYCEYLHHGQLKLGLSTFHYGTAWFLMCAIFLTLILPFFFYQKLRATTWHCVAYGFGLVVVLLRMLADIYQNTPQNSTSLAHEDVKVALIPSAAMLNVYLPRAVYALCLAGILQSIFDMNDKTKRKPAAWTILLLWSVTLAMLQRPFGSVIILTVPLVVDLLDSSGSSLLVRVALLRCLGHHIFFATYHQATFTSLPWKAAFVGFDDMNYYGGAILVALSTLSGHLSGWIGGLVLLANNSNEEIVEQQQQQQYKSSVYLTVLLDAIPTTLSAVFVLILRRHLMTWKIFAPRFLLQSLLGVGSHIAAILYGKLLNP